KKRQATSGMFGDGAPTFDRRGDWLYFVSTRAFQPRYEDLGTTWIYDSTNLILAVPLRADMKSPYAPESDEETPKPTSPAAGSSVIPAEAVMTESAATQADEVSGTWKGTASGEMLP